jgi:hypothetical protein
MSKFDEAVSSYTDALSSIGVKVDATVLTGVAKGLGPSIYLKDASLVSCTDQVELDRVKNNFLIGKLGLTDGPELDAALKAVCEKTSSLRMKPRAAFYYLLVMHFNKQGNYGG